MAEPQDGRYQDIYRRSLNDREAFGQRLRRRVMEQAVGAGPRQFQSSA